MVQVIMCISKALVGAQLRWIVREKKCYGIFYCFKVMEDMLEHLEFHFLNLSWLANMKYSGSFLKPLVVFRNTVLVRNEVA